MKYYCHDPQGDTLTYSLEVSNYNDFSVLKSASQIASIFDYDSDTSSPTHTSLTFNFLNNNKAGNYYLRFKCQDSPNPSVIGATF